MADLVIQEAVHEHTVDSLTLTTGTVAWTQVGAVLEASDAEDADSFGISVALSADGSVLAVGAHTWEGTGTNRGGVYIFDRSGSAWVQRGSVLEASDAANADSFGVSVALSADGSVLAVGAHTWEGTAGTDRGGVYIFDWSGTAWVQRGSVLEASDAADSDTFGISVALSDDGLILAVGAHQWESTGTSRGGVYTYDRSGNGWVQRGSVLEASDAVDSDFFGISVALSGAGGVLVVGAFLWEGASGTDRGGVYVYDRSGSSWVQRGAVLEAADAVDADRFGRSIALSADGLVMVVGANLWEGASGTDRGGVYIYDWSGSAWVQRGSVLEASDAADNDQFGTSISLSADGRYLSVGANLWEGASGTDRGGVYSYLLVSQDVLFVADTAHAHTADSLTLSSQDVLFVADTAHAHTADSLTLSLAGGDLLVVADTAHAHTGDSLTLSSQDVLFVADTAHAHTADSLTLSLAGGDLLVVADTAHAHTVDSLTLSSQDVLFVADTAHTHTVDGIALDLESFLSIAEISHNHIVDNVNVNTFLISELPAKYIRVYTKTNTQRTYQNTEFTVRILSGINEVRNG